MCKRCPARRRSARRGLRHSERSAATRRPVATGSARRDRRTRRRSPARSRAARGPAARSGRSLALRGLRPLRPLRPWGTGGGVPRSLLFLARRPPPEADKEDERHAELDYFVEPRAGHAVRRYRRNDHRDTTRLYAPLPSVPTPIVTFQVPASSPAIANLYRPGPSVAASSVASIGACDAGPEKVARTSFPTTGLPSAPTTTANIVSGAPDCGVAGSVNTIVVYGPIVMTCDVVVPPPLGTPTGNVKTVLTSSLPVSRTIVWIFQVPYIAVGLPFATYSPGARSVATSSCSPMSCSIIVKRKATFSAPVTGARAWWTRSTYVLRPAPLLATSISSRRPETCCVWSYAAADGCAGGAKAVRNEAATMMTMKIAVSATVSLMSAARARIPARRRGPQRSRLKAPIARATSTRTTFIASAIPYGVSYRSLISTRRSNA